MEHFSIDYPLAEDRIAGKGKVTVRFQAAPGQTAGGVFDVRMVTGR